jgi:hypothetical protein
MRSKMPDLELIALLTARLKQLEARLPSTVADAVSAWAKANRESLRGENGQSVSVKQVQSMANEWLAANITQPKEGEDAKPVDMVEVAQIVNTWLTVHYSELLPSHQVIEQVAQAWLSENIKQPLDGKNATESQIKSAAETWLRENIRQPQDGIGKDGVGIADIYQSSVNEIIVELTNGIKRKFTLPQPKITGGGTTTIVNKSGGNNTQWVKLDGVPHTLNFVSVGDDEVELELTPL